MNLFGSINRQGALWVGFFGLILMAWTGLFAMVRSAPAAGIPPGFWNSLCLTADTAGLPVLTAMWALMTAAMMLPTFVPALNSFLNLGATGATRPAEALALVLGYGVIWIGGACLGAWVQDLLSGWNFLAADGSSLSPWLTVALLLAAGLYQFSRIKAACLAKCRMPLIFFMERWAPGKARAFRMGQELGAMCFGCCWALMTLAFVGGTMNLLWMGAATVFMILEKLPELGRPLTRPAGYALIAAAGASALAAVIGS